jgi:hypothetical protein
VPPPDALTRAVTELTPAWFVGNAAPALEAVGKCIKTEEVPARAGFVPEGPEAAGRMRLSGARPEDEAPGGPGVAAVGTSSPVTDFQALLASGRTEEALAGGRRAVHALVGAAGAGFVAYDRALRLLEALRAAAATSDRPAAFNELLEARTRCARARRPHARLRGREGRRAPPHQLIPPPHTHTRHHQFLTRPQEAAARYKSPEQPSLRFWRMLVAADVKPISSAEAPSSPITPAQADDFLKQAVATTPAAPPEAWAPPPERMLAEEEEEAFAGME